jgi:hypothetical protein
MRTESTAEFNGVVFARRLDSSQLRRFGAGKRVEGDRRVGDGADAGRGGCWSSRVPRVLRAIPGALIRSL